MRKAAAGGVRFHWPHAVLTSAVITGASGYLVLLMVGRTLPASENVEFLAVWGGLFGAFTVVGGLGLQAAASVVPLGDRGNALPKAFPQGFVMAPALVLLAVVAGLVFRGRFPLPVWALPAILGVAVLGYVGQTLTAGTLAGLGNGKLYARVLNTEAFFRLVLVMGALVLHPTLLTVSTATALGAFSWLGAVLVPDIRRAVLGAVLTSSAKRFRRRAARATVASFGPAILIVGYPFLVKAIVPPDEYATLAGVMMAVILTRAPFLVPLAVAQPLLVQYVARHGAIPRGMLLGAASVSAVGVVLGSLLGPGVVEWVTAGSLVNPWVVGALVVASAVLACLIGLASSCLARGMHGTYLVAWTTAVGVAGFALALPGPVESRIVLGLLLGPGLGSLWSLFGLRKSSGLALTVPAAAESVSRDRSQPE